MLGGGKNNGSDPLIGGCHGNNVRTKATAVQLVELLALALHLKKT
jgi:hypothetical protein